MTASPSPPPADQVEAAQVLEPCPFGCVEIELVEIDAGRPPHFVVCHGCGAEGPPRLTMADAAEAWNLRPVAALRPVTSVAPEGMREVAIEPPNPDAWLEPPPHFKADPRWQRQPQSDEEWNRHLDGDLHSFRAKRRLAFASDLADPRAPKGMALVSRWDIITVLGRLTWLEARFDNTKESALPPASPPKETL